MPKAKSVDVRMTTMALDEPIYDALMRRAREDSFKEDRRVTARDIVRRALIAYLELDYEPAPRKIGRPSVVREVDQIIAESRGRRRVDTRKAGDR